MRPELLEIAIAGDASSDQIKQLVLQYFDSLGGRKGVRTSFEQDSTSHGFVLNSGATDSFREGEQLVVQGKECI